MFKWDQSKSSQKPLLSIAIPCYNRTEDLRLALQTFADQIEGKYENQVEIIVTDDLSPGPIAEMVSELAAKYSFIRLIVNKTNIGLEKNLINCTKECTGEYLWIFGDDDYLERPDTMDVVMGLLELNKHDFIILNRTRRSKDLSRLMTDNWMKLPEHKNFSYKGLREFCLDKGYLSVIGFISVNIFRRKPFVSASPKKYDLTMYPQLGMMLEAFHSSRVILIGQPHICHRTATIDEKRAELGNKATEKSFMSHESERNATHLSVRLSIMLNELMRKGAFSADDIIAIPENTIINGFLIDFVINSVVAAKEQNIDFTESQWAEARSFFDKLALTVEQKVKLRQVWPEFAKNGALISTNLTFSVITPSFNQAEFLPECLSMAQSQTLRPMEHLVFDPGSTDNSREIARNTPGITLVAEPDNGQSDAINKGFQRARGDIIAWVNSDDCYIDDLVFERVAERFEQDDAPDIVYGNSVYEDENGKFLRDAYVNKNPDSLGERLQQESGIQQPALFMRRSVIEKVGLLSPHRHYCMDYEYWIRCVKAGMKFAFIEDKLARVKYHTSNKTYGERDKSFPDVCEMLIDNFGYVNHIWLRRYAEYLSEGFDGVLTNSRNQDDVNEDKIEAQFVKLLRAYNTDHATYQRLQNHNNERGPKHTLMEMQKRGIGQSTDCKVIPKTQDWEPGHTSYVVATKKWAFADKWKTAQIAKTHNMFREAIAERKSDTCIIVGNGPSLNKVDFSMFEGQDVIVSNNVFLSPELMKYAKYYTVVNYLVAEQSRPNINLLRGVKKVLPYWLSYCLNDGPDTFFVDAVGRPEFSKDMFKNMSWRHTVTFFNMHLAYGLGYKKVILTGFDHSYRQKAGVKEGEVIISTEEDDNHFNGKYFQGKPWQAADVDMMEAMYKLAKIAFEEDGREIVNSTVGGHLNLFKRVPLAEALGIEVSELAPAADMKIESAVVSSNQDSRPFYADLADKIRRRSPALFRVGQGALWGLKFLKRHMVISVLGILGIAALIFAPLFLGISSAFASLFWIAAAIIVLAALGVVGAAYADTVVRRITARHHDSQKTLEAMVKQTAHDTRQEFLAAKGMAADNHERNASRISSLTSTSENEILSLRSIIQEQTQLIKGLSQTSQHAEAAQAALKAEIAKLRSFSEATHTKITNFQAESAAWSSDIQKKLALSQNRKEAEAAQAALNAKIANLQKQSEVWANDFREQLALSQNKQEADAAQAALNAEIANLQKQSEVWSNDIGEYLALSQSKQEADAAQAALNAEKINETVSAQREMDKRLEQIQQTSLSKIKFNEFQNRMITELSKKSLDGDQLTEISNRVAETRKKLDEEISKNSQSFSIAQEQLENRVEDKLSKLQLLTLSEDDQNMKDVAMLIAQLEERVDATGGMTQAELQSLSLKNEELSSSLKDSKSVMEAKLKDAHQQISMLKNELKQDPKKANGSAEKRTKREGDLEVKLLETQKAVTNYEADMKKTNDIISRLEEALNSTKAEIKEFSSRDEAEFQLFNRVLSNHHVNSLNENWAKPLNLSLNHRTIAYIAQRIKMIEQNSLGRLATSIEAAVLRILVAQSVPNKSLDVLEIGTLFGIGSSMIYDRANTMFEKVHMTVIDPLEGYYGNESPDILTNERVTRRALEKNFATAGMSEEDYSIIQGYSTADEVIEAASKRKYDLLIIDGDHSYTGVKTDFVNYAPFVKRGGYIIVDDYDTEHWPEIARYVDSELLTREDISLIGASWRTAVFRLITTINPV